MGKRTKRISPDYPKSNSVKAVLLYPAIKCIKEDIVIAVCKVPLEMKFAGERLIYDDKSKDDHFQVSNTVFLEGYVIDFSNVVIGTKVCCPKCRGDLSFLCISREEIGYFFE